MMEKLIKFLDDLKRRKFTGDVEINFNQGGVRGVKFIQRRNVVL